MIEVHKDALGNITGYYDTVKGAWVPPPDVLDPMDEDDTIETTAADQDDSSEPEPEPDFDSMTKAQLAEWLTNSGEEVSAKDSKTELLEQAKSTFAAQQEDTE